MMESREKKVDGPSPASNDGSDKKPDKFSDLTGPKGFDRAEAAKEVAGQAEKADTHKNQPKDGL